VGLERVIDPFDQQLALLDPDFLERVEVSLADLFARRDRENEREDRYDAGDPAHESTSVLGHQGSSDWHFPPGSTPSTDLSLVAAPRTPGRPAFAVDRGVILLCRSPDYALRGRRCQAGSKAVAVRSTMVPPAVE